MLTNPYFSEDSLDDLMRSIIERINAEGELIKPTKGKATEVTGVLLELINPRARLSRTESRGKLFSCLGYLCWYLAKDNSLDFISYYLPRYSKFANGDKIHGGYGPRLFEWDGIDQVSNVINLLKRNPSTRKAVIQIFDRMDIDKKYNDVACTCTLQFMIRNNSLHMVTYMRSNDVFLGLPHDIFCFTMLQEIIARTLSVKLGTYKHAVGSLHIYETNSEGVRQFLSEGWQSTETPMIPMPTGNPWDGITALLEAESALRISKGIDPNNLNDIDTYWGDLIRLLQVFQYKKQKNLEMIQLLREQMACKVYNPFIDKVLTDQL